ncbi:unnamed protein product [Symbiodinium natans]|uniref:PDZ domain-containing protein n=1 Tax=Symbiodinium natans TaxID=878477 RepID=A0A812TPB9_9DINO|nr:unnamed protein product [Symbiodinium natans]
MDAWATPCGEHIALKPPQRCQIVQNRSGEFLLRALNPFPSVLMATKFGGSAEIRLRAYSVKVNGLPGRGLDVQTASGNWLIGLVTRGFGALIEDSGYLVAVGAYLLPVVSKYSEVEVVSLAREPTEVGLWAPHRLFVLSASIAHVANKLRKCGEVSRETFASNGKEDEDDGRGEVKPVEDPPLLPSTPKTPKTPKDSDPSNDSKEVSLERKKLRARTWVQDVPSKVQTLTMNLKKPPGKEKSAKLGLDIDYAEEATAIPIVEVNGGLAGQWNEDNPMRIVRSGDCIVAVNGISKDVPNMLKTCLTCGALELLIVKGTTDESGMEPVASGLLAAEGYYQQVEAKQMAAAQSNAASKENPNNQATGSQGQSEQVAPEDLARSLARKRTLNWFVRG